MIIVHTCVWAKVQTSPEKAKPRSRSRCTHITRAECTPSGRHITTHTHSILVLTVMENHFLYTTPIDAPLFCAFSSFVAVVLVFLLFSLLCVANIFYAPTPTKQSTFQTVFSFAAPSALSVFPWLLLFLFAVGCTFWRLLLFANFWPPRPAKHSIL